MAVGARILIVLKENRVVLGYQQTGRRIAVEIVVVGLREYAMVTRVVICAFACVLAWSEAAGFNDAEFCTYAEEMARVINANSPDKIGDGLTLDGALVTCASKLFEFRKRADSVMQLGWRKERKRMWSHVVCKDPFLEASRNGWMIAEAVSFADGQQVVTYASCD